MSKQPVDKQPMDAWAEALQGAHGWPGRIVRSVNQTLSQFVR
jgi:hypothetical protein